MPFYLIHSTPIPRLHWKIIETEVPCLVTQKTVERKKEIQIHTRRMKNRPSKYHHVLLSHHFESSNKNNNRKRKRNKNGILKWLPESWKESYNKQKKDPQKRHGNFHIPFGWNYRCLPSASFLREDLSMSIIWEVQ